MSNVVDLNNQTVGAGFEISPDTILEQAKGNVEEVLVIGIKGGSPYVASTESIGDCLWLMEIAKRFLVFGDSE